MKHCFLVLCLVAELTWNLQDTLPAVSFDVSLFSSGFLGKMWPRSPAWCSVCSLPGCLSCPVGTHSWACCCSVRFGWEWLLTEVAEGEGLGGIQMVWLCKSIFLLNKIRFCSASNLFSCIRLLHVCARTMAGFPPALPSPSPCAALSGGNWPDPCVHLCPPVVCPRQPFGASLLHQSVQFTGGKISSALVCCVWPEARYLCVSRLLQHCWKY